LSSTTTISINSVLEIAAGKEHHLLLINDGSSTPKVLSIGRNTYGQLGNGTTTSSSGYFNLLDLSAFGTPIHVDCGEFYSIIVFQNGQIAMFGDNTFGQCGVNSSASKITVPTLSIGY
jgi:alpha-tubulin suppressor-like RCC1 family protein